MNETLILSAIFVAVLIGAFTVMSIIARNRAIRRNIENVSAGTAPRDPRVDQLFATDSDTIRHYYEVQKRNNPDGLEMRLIRAGYFNKNAKVYFDTLRILTAVAVFVLTWYLLTTFSSRVTSSVALLMGAIASGISFILMNVALDRMALANQTNYRRLFPDFMDLLIVCVDAGLSIEAAIDRVAREFAQAKPSFGNHLAIISLEVRAGRPLHDALSHFAERVKVDEARTLAILFRQSQELGSSVAKTLRVFSREMRQTRLIRAEEKANALPVKMLFPMAAFLFPVNLIIVLVPVMIQIMRMFLTMTPGGGG